MKKLYFVRHGQSELNVADLGAGHTETPLTAEGIKQAERAAVKAKPLHIDYIVSSPLSRAHDTAKIIAKAIDYPIGDIHINDLFIERYFGAFEKQPRIHDKNFDFDTVGGIEKTEDLLKRGRAALDYLEGLPYDNILVVAHGQIGRAIRHHVLEDSPFDYEHKLQNADLVQWI